MVPLVDRLQRLGNVYHRHGTRNAAIVIGSCALVVGLVGFERNLGPVYFAGLSEPIGFPLQALLLWLSFVCIVVAWYYHY